MDYKYEMEKLIKSNKPDPLSKDELKQRIADILLKGSKMKALASSPLSHSTNKTSRGHHGSFILPTQQSLSNSSSGSSTGSASTLPILQTPKAHLEGLTSLRLLCARLHFMGHLKYHLWRMVTNIQNEKIESSEELENEQFIVGLEDEDEEDNRDAGEVTNSMMSSRRKSTADSLLSQLKKLPFVPLSSEIASWNPVPPASASADLAAATATPPAQSEEGNQPHSTPTKAPKSSSPSLLYSIHGLGLFLVKFQRLYYTFMEVRLQFQENQDQNAIMKSASFLESLEIFAKEFKIALDSNLLMTSSLGKTKTTKETASERLDITVASFLNLPDWICPRLVSFPFPLVLIFSSPIDLSLSPLSMSLSLPLCLCLSVCESDKILLMLVNR
jgi:hypothetical protein